MKHFLIILVLISFSSCSKTDNDIVNNEGPQDSPENTNNSISPNFDDGFYSKVLPYQIIKIQGQDFLGESKDYKVLLDTLELEVENLTKNNFEFVIPRGLPKGNININVEYKGKVFNAGQLEILNLKDLFPNGIIHESEDFEDRPFLIMDTLNDIILPKIVQNELKTISFIDPNGSQSIIELNSFKLPKFVRIDSLSIVFGDYDFENGSVSIGYFTDSNPDQIEYALDIGLDSSLLKEAVTYQSKKNLFRPGDKQKYYDLLYIIIEVTSCAISIAGITPTLGLSIPSALLTCGSFFQWLAEYKDPDSDAVKSAAYSLAATNIALETIKCYSLSKKPTLAALLVARLRCTDLTKEQIDLFNRLNEDKKRINQDRITKIEQSFVPSLTVTKEIDPGGERTIFIGGQLSFGVKNTSKEARKIKSYTAPDDFELQGNFQNRIINIGETVSFIVSFYPTRIGTYEGTVKLVLDNDETINVKIKPITVKGWPSSIINSSRQISAYPCKTDVMFFTSEGKVTVQCPTGGNYICQQDGKWTFDGVNLDIQLTATLTYTDPNNGDTTDYVRTYSFSGSMTGSKFFTGNYLQTINGETCASSEATIQF